MKKSSNKTTSVAVFANAGIGNFLMYLSAICHAKEQKPNIRFDCIVLKQGLLELAQKSGLFEHVINSKQIILNFLNRRCEPYSAVLLSNHESYLLPVLLSGLVKSEKYIGFKQISSWRNKYHFLLTDKICLKSAIKENEAYLHLFKHFGIDVRKGLKPFFPFKQNLINNLPQQLKSTQKNPVIGLFVGFATHQTWKIWPQNHYAALILKLYKKYPRIHFVAFGDVSETQALNNLFKQVNREQVEIITHASLFEVADMVRQCDLMLCNDGGIMHVAEAVGTKVIAIFGPTDHLIFGPEPPSIIVRKNLACSPCYSLPIHKNNPEKCPHQKCLNDLSVTDVYHVVQKEIAKL